MAFSFQCSSHLGGGNSASYTALSSIRLVYSSLWILAFNAMPAIVHPLGADLCSCACCLWVSGQPSSCQVWSILKGVPWGWIQTYKSKCHSLCLVQLDTLLVAMLVWAWPIWHSEMYSTYSTWGVPHHITGVLFVGSLLVFSRFSCAIRAPFVYCKRYNIQLVLPPLCYSWQLPKNTKITHQTNYHHILWPLLTNDIKTIRVVQHKWYNFKSANCMLCQCRDPIPNFVAIPFPIYVHIQKDYKEKWKHFLCFLLMVWRLYF